MYVDPKVVVSLSAVNVKENKLIERKKVHAPNNWSVDVEGAGPLHTPTMEAILDKCADFPVHLHVTLKKHTSVICPCEVSNTSTSLA